jgi:glycosyltransferase involved in cell wall biosynthesis
MRVVIIPFGFFSDDLSSPEIDDFSAPLIADRIELLNEEFDTVTLIAGWEDGDSTVRRHDGNKYVTVRTTHRISVLKYLWRALRELHGYRNEDVVVVNFNPHVPGSLLATYCNAVDIPFVTYFIGLPEQSPGAFDKHILTHRYLLRHSDARLCTTPTFRERLQEIADVPIEIVPNGVHPMFEADDTVETQEDLVLYVGRFAPEKRLPLLVRAFATVRERGVDSRLVLIGARQDEKRTELEALAAELGVGDDVEIRSRIPREEVPTWMNRARTFVLPSRDEAFGMVLIEAMASGTPPIGMASGSVPWVINDAGPVCADEDELANAIERMLTEDAYHEDCQGRSLARATRFTREQWREDIRDAIYTALPDSGDHDIAARS